jgi:erythromycin esterase-like protein
MWRNEEVAAFLRWLRKHNDLSETKAGFYGLDLYSLGASIRAVIDYLERVDPEAARLARQRYGCLMAWQKDPAAYEVASLHEGFARCEADVLAMLRDLLAKRLDYARQEPETFLDAERNARIVAAAERYYRLIYRGARESWNLRDSHMFDTLEALLAAHPGAKAVVWAHNTHVGNAEATEMGRSGELNLGQLCRRAFAGDAVLVGMGTDRGTVAAATDWDGAMEEKPVHPALEGSFESVCRATGTPRFLVDFSQHRQTELGRALREPLLERALGAIYRPDAEWVSHYFDAVLPEQFDAWLWFEETVAMTPLPAPPPHGVPDTFPFGL